MKLLIRLGVRRGGSPGDEYRGSARNNPPGTPALLEVAEITGGAETAMVTRSGAWFLGPSRARPDSCRSPLTHSLTLYLSLRHVPTLRTVCKSEAGWLRLQLTDHPTHCEQPRPAAAREPTPTTPPPETGSAPQPMGPTPSAPACAEWLPPARGGDSPASLCLPEAVGAFGEWKWSTRRGRCSAFANRLAIRAESDCHAEVSEGTTLANSLLRSGGLVGSQAGLATVSSSPQTPSHPAPSSVEESDLALIPRAHFSQTQRGEEVVPLNIQEKERVQ